MSINYTSQIGSFKFPEAYDKAYTVQGMVELWKLPIEEDLLSQHVASISLERIPQSGPWGDTRVGDYLINAPREIEDLTCDIGRLKEIMRIASDINLDPESWALSVLQRFGGGRGYKYCFQLDEGEYNRTSPTGIEKGFDLNELIWDFRTECTDTAAEILTKMAAEKYRFGEVEPPERMFYVTFSQFRNPTDRFMFLNLTGPETMFWMHEGSLLAAVCKLPWNALVALHVKPETADENGYFKYAPHTEQSMLVPSEVYPSPDVENIKAFEETFKTLMKDGWPFAKAYQSARLL